MDTTKLRSCYRRSLVTSTRLHKHLWRRSYHGQIWKQMTQVDLLDLDQMKEQDRIVKFIHLWNFVEKQARIVTNPVYSDVTAAKESRQDINRNGYSTKYNEWRPVSDIVDVHSEFIESLPHGKELFLRQLLGEIKQNLHCRGNIDSLTNICIPIVKDVFKTLTEFVFPTYKGQNILHCHRCPHLPLF